MLAARQILSSQHGLILATVRRGAGPHTTLHHLCLQSNGMIRLMSSNNNKNNNNNKHSPSSSSSSSSPTTETPTASSLSETTTSTNTKSQDIVVKLPDGGKIVLPSHAATGLSSEYRGLLEERTKTGVKLPFLYRNPGAYGQVERLPTEVIQALPPPAKPLWPMKENEITWKYVRGFSLVLLMVALAAYLHAKRTLTGSARVSLERNVPSLAQALVKLGILKDYVGIEANLDRKRLFQRVFHKYTPNGERIPTGRALRLLQALAGGGDDARTGKQSHSGNKTSASSSSSFLSETEFIDFMMKGSKDISNIVVYLGCDEVFGIADASPAVIAELEALYDRIVVARSSTTTTSSSTNSNKRSGQNGSGGGVSGKIFSVSALADLATDIGFTADEVISAAFLTDCAAVATGEVPLPSMTTTTTTTKTTPSVISVPSSFAAPLRKSEFVNFMASSATAAALDEERISEYLKVFYMLHMSGIREKAGVQSMQ